MSLTSAASAAGKQRFHMLDLLRGLAAISVLVYHTHQAGFLDIDLLPNAYLAVDMFFLLSGFVIAHNYDDKIRRGMGLHEFMVQRLIRLFPCLILTLLLGILVTCVRMQRNEGFLDGRRILAAAVLNVMFLPAVSQPYGTWGIYPFNPAAWSLTFELVANVVYFLAFRQLGSKVLGSIIVGALLAMIVGQHVVGTIDAGMLASNFWWGLPRVTLTFFIGVAVRRHYYGRLGNDLGRAAAPLVLVCLMVAFSWNHLISAHLILLAELLTVSLLFPLLLLAVGGAKPGPRTADLCKWTGDASYPVYLLQNPFMAIFAAMTQVVWGMKASVFTPWIGAAFIVTTVISSVWADRYYELPLRQFLRAKVSGPRSVPM